ncbi:hypothetical protein [Mycobacteroides abscessus]|uniref:hypothetical protein n=1 Tax=Mycobacteroides abscessus TaxID=36809 RepID=UPI0009260475|nr:hypothetical protein [Mycobacteroides abscessus]SIB67265.1 putative secreted protein [Mycobacteroides abscessus subsp. abscessus]
MATNKSVRLPILLPFVAGGVLFSAITGAVVYGTMNKELRRVEAKYDADHSRNQTRSVLGGGDYTERTVTMTVTATPAPLPSIQTATETTIPGDGTYRVGPEVTPGTYRSLGNTDCYWEKQNANGGIVANQIGDGQMLVIVTAHDGFFRSQHCQPWMKVGGAR